MAAPESGPQIDIANPATARRSKGEVEAAKNAIRRTRTSDAPARTRPEQSAEIADDDAVVDDPELSSQDLLARELGAQVIADIRDDVAQ
jgi:hypothetical protein